MPRLPDATDLAHPTPRSQRSIVTDNSAEVIGQAVEGAGRTLIRAVEQREERQDRIGYANARSTLLQADIAARRELENDNDWQTYEERYREKVGQARQDASQFIRGRSDRALFEQDTAADLERGVSEIRSLARRKEVDIGRSTLADTLQKNRTAALEATDEKTRGALITSSKEALRGSMERGYISAQEESDQRHSWLADYAEGHLDVQTLPERIRLLKNPKKTPADYIAPDRRAVLLKAAQNELRAEQDRARVEARMILTDQMQDISAAAQAGIPVKQVPSKAAMQAAFGEREGAQRYESARKLANMSVEIASLHGLPADDLIGSVSAPQVPPDLATAVSPLVAHGRRNLKTGGSFSDADGLHTILSGSVSDERLNDGRITVIPFVYEGRMVSQDEAIDRAIASGVKFPIASSEEEATRISKAASRAMDQHSGSYFGPPREQEGAAEQAQLHSIMSRAVSDILTARKKDPAGYLLQHSEPVQKAWTALQADPEASRSYLSSVRAEKERLGIDGADILPNAYVQGIADDLNTAPTAEQLASRVEQEVERWGDAWPAVQSQLSNKVSDLTLVMGSGIPRSASVALASTMKLKDTELKAMLPASTKWSDVEDSVDTQFADFQRSLPPEAARTWNAVRDSALRLSVKYMNDGNSKNDAVDRAYRDLVESQYQLTEMRGVQLRIPVTVDAEAVEMGARLALESFQPDPASIVVPPGAALSPEEYAGQWQRYIRDKAYWVTRPDGKGVRLYADGGPVIGASGPVDYTWTQLQDTGSAERASDEAERIQRQRTEALKRQQMR